MGGMLVFNGCPSKGASEAGGFSYGVNSTLTYPAPRNPDDTVLPDNNFGWGLIRTDGIKAPSQFGVVVDSSSLYETRWVYSTTHYERRTLGEGRHLGQGLGFLYADGHAEFLLGHEGVMLPAGVNYPNADWRLPHDPGHGITTGNATKSCKFGGCIWHPRAKR